MMPGVEIPNMILTSCQTHSVQFIAMFRNRKVVCLAALAAGPGGRGGALRCSSGPRHLQFDGPTTLFSYFMWASWDTPVISERFGSTLLLEQ